MKGWVRLAACMAVATGGHAAGVARASSEAPPPGVTVPVKINTESDRTPRTYTPAAVVVDPQNPSQLYAATIELRSRRCGFSRSRDGGRTWTPGASPSPPSHPLCSHVVPFMPMAALAMGSEGRIYYLHRGWSHQDEGPEPNSSVFLARSDDGGGTWEATAVRDARRVPAPDNEVNFPTDVAVDASGADDVVYVSWTTTFPTALPRRAPEPTVSISTDGGQSFSKPTNISEAFFQDLANLPADIPEPLRTKEHFGGALPYMALDDQGVLSATWVRRTANVDPVEGQPRYLSRSDDRGKTFTTSEMAPASAISNAGAVLEWTAHGGGVGTLHAVYEDKRGAVQGDRDVYYRRSSDAGRTWTDVRALNDDDPAQLFSQLLPSVAAAPNGRLDVTWWDNRRSVDQYATDVYYTHSEDAGLTWSPNVALNDVPVSRRFGSWVDNFGNARQAPALASTDALAVAVWDDTRLGTTSSPVQDLYSAVVQYQPLRSEKGSSTQMYAGSALAGAIAGLVVFLIRRRLRRPEGVSPGP